MAPRVTLPAALLVLLGGGLLAGIERLALPIALALVLLLLSALRRPALFVFVCASLLLLPMLGAYGLWDPWETHYGEVAREILARDDWITLWWAQDEWFRSKPILIFWIEALSWGALGMPFERRQQPGPPRVGDPPAALHADHERADGLLRGSARVFGRRAAVIASLVLATTPYFFLLAHQAITDMPFVSTMTVALALFAIAMESGDERVKRYRLAGLSVSVQSVLLLLFVMVALPQALYLISRNVTFVVDDLGFWAHRDSFVFGSAGNADVPGNPAHQHARAVPFGTVATSRSPRALLWLLGLWALVVALKREARSASLAMFGFYLFCSLSWMAKGIPGFALPGLIAGMYLLATRRFAAAALGTAARGHGHSDDRRDGSALVRGHVRAPRPVLHRPPAHSRSHQSPGAGRARRHWQHPVLPVAARLRRLSLDRPVPAGLRGLALPHAAAIETHQQRRTALLFSLWGVAAFALFNAMITKFHHYIFPAVPPLSLLVGIVLERALGERSESAADERRSIVLACAGAGRAGAGLCGPLRRRARRGARETYAAAQMATWVADNSLEHGPVRAADLRGAVAALLFAARAHLDSRARGRASTRRRQGHEPGRQPRPGRGAPGQRRGRGASRVVT